MVTVANESPSRPRVLVVDDDPGIRMAIRSILETDYIVTEAETIKESLAIFDRQPQDLITLDIQMPEVDGMQGLGSFRHRSVKIPIILISGYRTFELAREALRLGANDYLTKPFSVQELRETVKAALTKVNPTDDRAPEVSNSISKFTVRLPLQDLMDNRFLSPRHRAHFLAFAQNVLSDKRRASETLSLQELIKTIAIQFDALSMVANRDYKITHSRHPLRIECDMYLLGGAMANLALTCIQETKENKALIEIAFNESGQQLKVLYRKPDSHLSPKTLETFAHWRQDPSTELDPNATMLVLAEKVVRLHQGQFIVNATAPSDVLVEISLPVHQSIAR